MPGEDEVEYQQLEAQFIKDFSPQDIAEMTMVRELAVVVWKKHRLERLELSSSLKALNQSIEDSDYRRHGLLIRDTAIHLVERSEVLNAKFIAMVNKTLSAAELFVDRELSAVDIDSMKLNYPYLYEDILDEAKSLTFFKDKTPTVEELVAYEVVNNKGETLQFFSYAVSDAIAHAKDILWAYKNADKFKAATQSIKAQRLLSVMELEMPRRVNDDLSRIFFRTLSELRKHQQWRQAKNTVDVTPNTPKNND